MSSNDSPQNDSDSTGDDWDFPGPSGSDSKSGVKDPTENPEAWDICRDFIDRLADDLEEWLRKPVTAHEDIEELEWFAAGVDGAGPQAHVAAWSRAKMCFTVNVSEHFQQEFEEMVSGLADQARNLKRRLAAMTEADDFGLNDTEGRSFIFDRKDVEIKSFIMNVERCLDHFRDASREMRRVLPLAEEDQVIDSWGQVPHPDPHGLFESCVEAGDEALSYFREISKCAKGCLYDLQQMFDAVSSRDNPDRAVQFSEALVDVYKVVSAGMESSEDQRRALRLAANQNVSLCGIECGSGHEALIQLGPYHCD